MYIENKMPWIIEGRLFQSRYPHFTSDVIDYQDPEKYAINVIVNLQDHRIASYQNHILDTTQVIIFPIMDYCIPDDYREFKKLIDRLVDLYNEGKNILIHCQGGRGRSSVVSCCLYARIKESTDAYEVLRRVSDKVGCIIPETKDQEEYIVHYISRRKYTSIQNNDSTDSSEPSIHP
jgi:protein-tyrosine phosphatase